MTNTISIIGDVADIGDDWFIFGFDTCHYGDTPEDWNRETVEIETVSLYDQLNRKVE